MGTTVAVAGASGYAGGELVRLLDAHPSLELGPLAAASSVGRPVSQLHPNLPTLATTRFVAADPAALAEADVVVLAVPHGESAKLAARLPDSLPVLDMGADHRLRSARDWSAFYNGPHAGSWPYGLPELPRARDQIASARRVAGPGCYATAVTLALAPLLAGGLVEPADLVVVAASGTSGAGREAKAHLLGSEVMGDVSAYKVGGVHQHLPEIEQSLSQAAMASVSLSFTPLLAPMPRGILATCTARLRPDVDDEALRSGLVSAYAEEPFVHVLPAGVWPRTAATAGSNSCHLQVTADQRAGRAVVVAAIDNLGKGAAGQALQCLNIMLGLPETAGLSTSGLAP